MAFLYRKISNAIAKEVAALAIDLRLRFDLDQTARTALVGRIAQQQPRLVVTLIDRTGVIVFRLVHYAILHSTSSATVGTNWLDNTWLK